MPVISPPVPIEESERRRGGGGVHPPARGGGGDNGPGDGSFNYRRRLHRARLALLLALSSVSVLFVTLTVIFMLMRHGAGMLDAHSGNYIHQWIPIELPLSLLMLNTLILLTSSVTIEMSRRSVAREMVLAPVRSIPGIALDREFGIPWLSVTIALGMLFLFGQWAAWRALQQGGFHMFSGVPSPFFFILTGAHAIHLAGGLAVLSYAGLISLIRPSIEHRRIVIEVAAWYWHFMGILWIYIFALLYLAG
ncbi:MAG: cytochrome c oxidase subunit 3 [Terriglobales bacterium]